MGNKIWKKGDMVVSNDNRYKGQVEEVDGNIILVRLEPKVLKRFRPNQLKRQYLGK